MYRKRSKDERPKLSNYKIDPWDIGVSAERRLLALAENYARSSKNVKGGGDIHHRYSNDETTDVSKLIGWYYRCGAVIQYQPQYKDENRKHRIE